jgi:peptidoglycan/LPS O-acetylase OafA/YrhL
MIHAVKVNSTYLAECSPGRELFNLTMLPLGYQKNIGLSHCLLMPQSWTLGLVLTFYLLFPFIAIKPRFIPLAALLSCMVAAPAYLGVIQTDAFGYTLLPGALLIFLAGAILSRFGQGSKIIPLSTWTLRVIGFVCLLIFPWLVKLHYNKQVLMGGHRWSSCRPGFGV